MTFFATLLLLTAPLTFAASPPSTLGLAVSATSSLRACAGPTPLSTTSQPRAADLGGLHLDASGELVVLRHAERDDRRANLALYGQRPTLLVFGTTASWRESKAKEYVKALKALDKRATKWARAGVEVVYVDTLAWVQDGDDRVDLDLTARAKVKHMTCVRAADGSLHETRGEPAREQLLQPAYTEQLEFRWVLLEELGVVAASGDDALDKGLTKRLGALEPNPLAAASSTKKAFAALDAWRLGDVERRVIELEANDDPSASALRAKLLAAEAHFRAVFHAPEVERGYLVEAAAHLEQLAEVHYAEGPGAERVREEVAALRATPVFARAAEHHAQFQEQLATYERMDRRLAEVYEASLGRSEEYDELKYNKAIREVYPEPLAHLTEFVRTQTDSPYRRAIASLVTYAREELQDAGDAMSAGR